MKKKQNKKEKEASKVELDDVFKALAQSNLPRQEQIHFLTNLQYLVHSKTHPKDTSGIIGMKIKTIETERENAAPFVSNLELSKKKGVKVNFIRIINIICELRLIVGKNNIKVSKKEVFEAFGILLNQDFSTFHNDLSSSKSSANSDMKSSLTIFKQMYDKQVEINEK